MKNSHVIAHLQCGSKKSTVFVVVFAVVFSFVCFLSTSVDHFVTWRTQDDIPLPGFFPRMCVRATTALSVWGQQQSTGVFEGTSKNANHSVSNDHLAQLQVSKKRSHPVYTAPACCQNLGTNWKICIAV